MRGTLELNRGDLRDRVELKPILSRKLRLPGEHVDDAGNPLASYLAAIVGFGDRAIIDIDEPAISPLRGTIRVRWEDFRNSAVDWRRKHDRDLFYLDLNDTAPTVFLNNAHSGYRQALENKRKRGIDAVLKQALMVHVAQSAWTSMFFAALAACPVDDGVPSWPLVDWKEAVLKKLLSHMFADKQPEQALAAAHELANDGSRIETITATLGSAIQEVLKLDTVVLGQLETALAKVVS